MDWIEAGDTGLLATRMVIRIFSGLERTGYPTFQSPLRLSMGVSTSVFGAFV
jgi:hypothetical protein